MKNDSQLRNEIFKLEGRAYPAYKDLKGSWDFGDYILRIDHVQSDPFASPSDLSVLVDHPGFPSHLYENKAVRVALQDQMLRLFSKALKAQKSSKAGSGKSGVIRVSLPNQEVLERSACKINPDTGALCLRIQVGFPAKGRRILAKALIAILFDQLPKLIRSTLLYQNLTEREKEQLQKAFELTVDQQYIRQYLKQNHLVAFVGNGAILPRVSGNCDRPMQDAIVFESPIENKIEIDLPYGGKISGMGIPEGITLIVGGGYHGKSTLLKALERGVYNHIEGDGREYVITVDDAVKVRAEDGRSVHQEDISMFIQNLPNGKPTKSFSTEDASGSTSQAANVIEALESGSNLLLMDEDTSATNFMIRDALMSSVVHPDSEPIIPFIARIEELKDAGVSTILVAGSSGSYFDKADLVLQMKEYEPYDITRLAKEKAKDVAEVKRYPKGQAAPKRIPLKNSHLENGKVKVKTTGTDTISINREPIDVRYLEQLTDSEQLSAIGKILLYLQRSSMEEEKTIDALMQEVEALLDEKGLDYFGKGNLARPRKQEIMGALNRWRSQQFKQV